MSRAVGSFCFLNQEVTSWNYTEGAAVALAMQEYERERELFLHSSCCFKTGVTTLIDVEMCKRPVK